MGEGDMIRTHKDLEVWKVRKLLIGLIKSLKRSEKNEK